MHKDCFNAVHYKFSGGLKKKNVNMQLMQNFMDGRNLIYCKLCKYLGKACKVCK